MKIRIDNESCTDPDQIKKINAFYQEMYSYAVMAVGVFSGQYSISMVDGLGRLGDVPEHRKCPAALNLRVRSLFVVNLCGRGNRNHRSQHSHWLTMTNLVME